MSDKPSSQIAEEPVFGPNGVVLNAPTMTAEMRKKIYAETKWRNKLSKRQIVAIGFVSSVMFFAPFIADVLKSADVTLQMLLVVVVPTSLYMVTKLLRSEL